MALKDIMSKLGQKGKERKQLIRDLDEQVRIQKIVEDRQKSANERELERFIDEQREKEIKEQLKIARKQKDQDIKFNHNPLNTKNIMKAEWEIMKEPNMFKGKSNMFSNQSLIHKSNPKLLHNAKWLMK